MSDEQPKKTEKVKLSGRILSWLFIIIILVVIIAALYLGLGGSTPTERNATASAHIATSDALKQSYFQTQTAAPTRTPMPAYVPGPTKSPFENCAQSKYGIKYIISGTGVSAVSLTFESDTGGVDQGDYRVPFCKIFNNFQSEISFIYPLKSSLVMAASNVRSLMEIRLLPRLM